MRLPPPSMLHRQTFDIIIELRRLVLRYFALVRPHFLRMKYLDAEEDHAPGRRYHTREYLTESWYMEPKIAKSCRLQSWALWVLCRPTDGSHAGHDGFCSQDYLISDLGPDSFHGEGTAEMAGMEARPAKTQFGTCPVFRTEHVVSR